ncbi:hypothetical protein [Spiroplasma phoeniceum]|uniref:Uncharacterized protein n=1 Tax=Spiroplasma phoeniceum P40 TaxID=1276259 RepID=A0A345DP83_9MOLU|nr:hypothetical protein [Spiroplasma phoeniceum]AXF96021.1 hypothetical protein SDAV_001041 [Spiroplasma phoeniceum P40]
MNVTETIKFNKVKEENEKLKKELAELKKQQILYKEDFYFQCRWGNVDYDEDCETSWQADEICHNNEHKDDWTWQLKDNSKYDTLPSKEGK